jgi:hypothetical protein
MVAGMAVRKADRKESTTVERMAGQTVERWVAPMVAHLAALKAEKWEQMTVG